MSDSTVCRPALVALVLLAGCKAGRGTLSDGPSSDAPSHGDSMVPADSSMVADAPADARGGSGVVVATGSSPFALTVDDTTIYWSDPGLETVSSIPIAGGTATTLATNLYQPYFLQHDATSLYWGLNGDVIASIPLGGGTPFPLQASNNTGLTGLAVDATNVYHTEDYTVPQDCSVVAVPKGGGMRVTLASGGNWNIPTGLAVSGGTVYWGVIQPGAILMVPAGGGATSTLVSGVYPIAIVTDATNVYWTDESGAVMKVAQAGGTPVTLAKTANPYAIAVDGTNVYWTTLAYATPSSILKVPIAGGTAVTLESGLKTVRAIAVDATNIYWTEEDGGVVKKAPK
jgi:hypothetical protein